ncbi:MAG TPA: glycosyltransferase [Gammaproteobacteria bacterium]|nr:glycosyltransferase [Gammaproteobacteria bacterium]
MKIAFFGSSIVSAWWNGAATYYRGLLRELAALGHDITFYEPAVFERHQHRDIDDPEWARIVIYAPDDVRRMLHDASDADVIVKASGVGANDAMLERAVLTLKRPDNQVIFWDVDAPATLERLEHDRDDPFRVLVPEYDLVLTYGGGPPVVAAYEGFGAQRCVPIYNALDRTTHFPVEPDERFMADLVFIGNRLPDREARVDEFFFNAAECSPQRQFLLGGNGWQERAAPVNVRLLGHVYTRDHNAINSSALAVLNISRASMARVGYSPATRVFEAAGAGACLITDAWTGIEEFFEPGEEILVAECGAEVADLLNDLTAEDARRIGDAALARVRADHTYASRAAEVDALLRSSPLSLRERARVRVPSSDNALYYDRHLETDPHPNPSPEGRGA